MSEIEWDVAWFGQYGHLPCVCGHALAAHVAEPSTSCADCKFLEGTVCLAWYPDGVL